MAKNRGISTIAVVGILIVVAIAAFFIGSTMSAPQTPPVDDTISLTILAGEDPIIARGIEILQERFPEETFDIEHIAREGSDLREYALISMAGGEFPDVYFCDSIWMGEFVKAGFLEDLPASWLNELTGWPDDWHENTRDGMTWDNKTYGIWWDTDTRIWMYNKEFINESQFFIIDIQSLVEKS